MHRRFLLVALAMVVALPAAASAVDLRTVSARALLLKDGRVTPAVKSMVRTPEGGSGAISRSFGDLTRDGRRDMIVRVHSGGTAGVLAYYVYAEVGGRVRLIRAVNDTYRVGVGIDAKRRLVERNPIYAADDPNCCPSAVRVRVFRWNGRGMALVLDRRVATPAP